MFTPIHLLPQFSGAKRTKYEDRWHTEQGQELEKKVIAMIHDGAGEDFLQWEFEQGRLGFLEDMWDLKGLSIFSQQFAFKGGDTFEAINFSYAQFYHSKFDNAVFNCRINFARIYNCDFVNCLFSFNGCYSSVFENCRFTNCEFFEHNSFTNCIFKNVTFRDCFIPDRVFFDCNFDERTEIGELTAIPVRMKSSGLRLESKERAEIYKGIREAFAAGEVVSKARAYYFKQMQCVTRFNTSGKGAKVAGYILEYLTGYGVKPVRVVLAMLVVFFMVTLWFSARVGFADGLLLVAGAFFTFGAKSDLLNNMGLGSKLIYVATSFAGIGLTALFVTVLANKWLRER
jgi:hypothetical protein